MNPNDNIKFWCALLRTPKIGCNTFNKLLLKTTPEELFNHSPKDLRRWGLHPLSIQALQNPNWTAVQKDLDWLNQDNHYLITLKDPHYPPLLKEITNPPPYSLFTVTRTRYAPLNWPLSVAETHRLWV